MTLFDTDILISFQKGYRKAAELLQESAPRVLSQYSVIELLQGSQNTEQMKCNKRFITDLDFRIIPLSAAIGNRAIVLIEDYKLSHNLLGGDAIIAATAMETGARLCTSNFKHFKGIPNLEIQKFLVK